MIILDNHQKVKREEDGIFMSALLALDGNLLLLLQEHVRNAITNPLVQVYTKLGDAGIMWIVLSVLLLCFRSTRKAGIASLFAMILGLLCTNVVLKHLIARPRPWLDVMGLVPLVNEPDPNSFPSGHTCAAFAASLSWWRTLPNFRMKILGIVLAVLMGLSRLYVGVHYPSDVLVGALVGAFCAWVACRVIHAWEERRSSVL